jgi:hypothetical protein
MTLACRDCPAWLTRPEPGLTALTIVGFATAKTLLVPDGRADDLRCTCRGPAQDLGAPALGITRQRDHARDHGQNDGQVTLVGGVARLGIGQPCLMAAGAS